MRPEVFMTTKIKVVVLWVMTSYPTTSLYGVINQETITGVQN